MPQYYTLLAATETDTHAADDAHADEEVHAVEASHAEEDTHATTGAADSHGADETGAAVLGIDPLAIALQAGTFLILFIIIKKFALEKIVHNLEERRNAIDEGLKNAEDIELQKAELERQNEKALADARKHADEIIGKSHEEAGSIVADAQARANKQADDIVEKAKSQAENEANKVRGELKSEMLGLISEATETVLDEKMTGAKDQQLIEKALNQGANS